MLSAQQEDRRLLEGVALSIDFFIHQIVIELLLFVWHLHDIINTRTHRSAYGITSKRKVLSYKEEKIGAWKKECRGRRCDLTGE